MIARVVSGGQTGVDRGALEAALNLGIKCGGWCPKDRRAEDGVIPDRYPLTETDSADYRVRTQRNVTDSDGTLILIVGRLIGGTALTHKLAIAENKPCRVVDLDSPVSAHELRDWIRNNGIETLNVAGPRESQRPGIARRAQEFLSVLLSETNDDETISPAR